MAKKGTHLLFWVMSLLMLSNPVWALSKECRASQVAPIVTFQSGDVRTALNHEKSSAEITALSKSVGALRDHGDAKLLGLAYTRMKPGIRVRVQGQQEKGGRFCITLQEVQMSFDTEESLIYVDRKYQKGSCAYQAILEHEQQHMQINRRVLGKYKKLLEDRLNRQARAMRPLYATSIDAGAEIVTNRLSDDMKGLINEFFRVRERENGKIDTQKSYAAVKRKCKNW